MNPQKIISLLNNSSSRLDAATLDRLQAIRSQALQRQHSSLHARTLALDSHASHMHRHISGRPHRLAYWVGGLLLAVGILSGLAYWQQTSVTDTSDVDIAILTGDLPIKVYVD